MNEYRGKNSWDFRMKIVSGILTALLVFAGLFVLFPISSDVVFGYTIPSGVSWNMDDLVSNSSGAVTSGIVGDYYVHDDIYVSTNSTLTASPGQNVYFDSGTGFFVYGSLIADGTNASMISFTSNLSSPSYGDWDGINFFGTGTVDYVVIEYAENGILANNISLTVTNSEFMHNVWGVHMIGGYCHLTGNTFTDNGILPHPDPYNSQGGGVYVENNTYGYIEGGNVFNSNIGGVRVSSSMYLHIFNNYFSDNTVYGIYIESGGDYWKQNYVNIHGNEISNSENYGIYAEFGYESFIDNNNITGNRVGIHIGGGGGPTGGGGSIYNNYIAFNWEIGIECYGSALDPSGFGPYINGNDIICNNISGIYLQDSAANIYDNEIIGCCFGIYALNSTPTIQNTRLESTQYALWANNSEVQITDSEIVSRYVYDYYLESDAYITSLNTTFDHHSVHFNDDVSVLEVQWYLHILVINISGPVASADVTVSDNENGTWSQAYVTGTTGRVNWIVVTEYIRDLYSWVYYTPHNITATKGSEVGYAEPFMDISKFVVVDLTPGAVPTPPLPPFNLTIALNLNDLELTWEPSPDDGGGEGDVLGYIVYRAESVYGPYTNVSFVNATGLPFYSWADPGLGDGEWSNYFYIVRAKDADGLEDGNSNKVGKIVSDLAEGWNLLSVPFVQEDTSRETVLQTIENNYASVYGYHAGKSRPWLHWHRDKPNEFNDVIEMNHREGYYIDMIISDHLVTVGNVAPQVDINLKSGWNLVGNPCLTERTRDDALSSIAGKYNMVEYYDPATDKEVRLGASDYMYPGLGYWIHATESCVLSVTN